MANTFVTLPVPATDGVGAWADVSGIAPSKTLTVDGGSYAGQLYIECANDNQISAAPAPTPVFSAGLPNAIEFTSTLRFMRVRRVGSSQGPAGTPTVVVGGLSTAGNVFAAVAVPALNGTGAPTSIAGGGEINTFAVVGPFSGALFIEFSNDGVDFSSNIRFDNGNAIPVTFNGVIASVRVRNQLTSGSSVPTVNVGSGSDLSAGTAGVLSVNAGTGISVTGTGSNPIVNNTGVLAITGGSGGVTITGTGSNPVVNVPVAVTSVSAGTGISVTGTATAPIVNNTGVLTVTAGTNVTVTGTGANPVVNVPSIGVTSVSAGTGISITGTATVPIVNNTGVLTVAAGTGGVTITGTGANPVVNVPTAVTSVSAGTGISITGTATAPIVNNTGVLSVTAGTGGVNITGTGANPVVNVAQSITLATFAFGYTGGTPGTLITNTATWGAKPYSSTMDGAGQPFWRVPIALSSIETWLNITQYNDAGSGGSLQGDLLKNGINPVSGIVQSATGLGQFTQPSGAFAAGDRYGYLFFAGGTNGVFVDFTIFARGIVA